LIVTAALELSGNQVTHFYNAKKNTVEMIRLMDVLVNRYADRRKLYLSWDVASWHISKQLFARIEAHNSVVVNGGGPLVETTTAGRCSILERDRIGLRRHGTCDHPQQ
jgi:hypothetical protein